MKIAFIISSFPKLSETFILNQITGLIDLGYDIEILAFNNPNEEKFQLNIKKYNLMERVHYIPGNRIKRIFYAACIIIKNFYRHPLIILKSLNFFKYKKMALSLKPLCGISFFLDKKFDILHCFYGPNGILGAILRDIGVVETSIITSFYGYDLSAYIVKNGCNAYDFLFRNGDYFLPISDYWKKKLIELGCKESKILVHKTGVDLNKFNYKEKKNNKKNIRLITIGRLVEKKGINYGIEAVAKLIKKYPDIEYNIIGDGPLREMFNDLIKKLAIGNKVKILGFKKHEDVAKLIKKSDILLAPSIKANNGDQEGIPNVLMEAMAMGTTVISTYHSGIPELIKDGESGFLVNERDVDSLAKKISYLIDNPEIRKYINAKGRREIEENYDIRILNKQLDSFYKKISNKLGCSELIKMNIY